MVKFSVSELDTRITTIANGVFGNIETKKSVQELLINIVLLSCRAYESSESFKSDLERLAKQINQ